jgi:hypothetical protein
VRGLLSLHSTPLRPLAISAALKQSGLEPIQEVGIQEQ